MLPRIPLFLFVLAFPMGVVVTACSEDSGCASSAECPAGQVCNGGFCEKPAANNGDTTSVPNDSETTSDGIINTDVGGGTADSGGPGQDDTQSVEPDTDDVQWDSDVVEPKDVYVDTHATPNDTETPVDTNKPKPGVEGPPKVVSVDPADGVVEVGLPFVVKITFNEPIRVETVDSNTFRLLGIGDDPIGGPPELAADGLSVTLSPKATAPHYLSPYTVRIDPVVQDLEGNQLGSEFLSTFFTGAPDGWETYEALAHQYSPSIWQTLSKKQPQYDYPTAFDADNNVIAADNPTWIQGKAKTVTPAVYWDIAETKSHWVLTYTLFYPYRDPGNAGGKTVANDTAAVMIVVQKHPEPTPVAAITYGRRGDIQDMFAFVASGSALDGKPLVDEKAPLDTLFPGGRFALYVTSPQHQACCWTQSGPGECELNEGIKIGQTYLVLSGPSDSPTPISKDGSWPTAVADATYELRSAAVEWWARRDQFGDTKVWASGFDFNYEPEAGRPGGGLKKLPSFFGLNAGTDGGRPPWSWSWKPGGFGQFTKLPQGTPFLDPAWFLSKRFGLGNTWDSGAQTGFSTDYCFHPTLDIDNRTTDPDCK